tara:strand:- start:1080 stop:1982 length:903 start_codon:yes stop_codon:yes gene_type:complete
MPTINPEQLATGSYNLSGSFSGSFSGTVTGALPPFPFSGSAQIIGNVTASGNISASGDISATGNISSSGNVLAGNVFLPGAGKISFDNSQNGTDQFISGVDNQIVIDGDDLIVFKADTDGYEFRDTSNAATVHITTAGAITASGIISASNLTGTNTGDQDLSSLITSAQTASISVLSASFATTASHLLNNPSPFPFTGSAIVSGSLQVTGSIYTDSTIYSPFTIALNFETPTTYIYKTPYSFRADSIESDPSGSISIIYQASGSTQLTSSYSVGNPLNKFDKLIITPLTASLVVLNSVRI